MSSTLLSPDSPSSFTTPCARRLTSVLLATLAVAAGVPSSFGQDQPTRVERDAARVAEAYLVGPKTASDLGLSIAWQALVPVPAGQSIVLVESSRNGVLALNSRNEVTLVRPATGDRAWTASGAQQVDRVVSLDIVQVPTREGMAPRVVVISDTTAYGLDLKDGASVMRGRFRHVPNTRTVAAGGRLVFGTRGGQVSWFDCATGFDISSYTVDGPLGRSPILAAPATDGSVIVAASSKGTVVALDAKTAALRWRKEILGGVREHPTIANGVAFVASEDQYLYAFDLESGSTLWKYFTQTPLTAAPFAAGSLVLQDIPGEGLVAFTQNPEGQIGGEVRWKRAGLDGKPISTIMSGGTQAAMLWCGKKRLMTLVDLRNGDVIRTVELPKVERLAADTIEAGGLVAWSSDGRILRLSPVGAASSAAPSSASAK